MNDSRELSIFEDQGLSAPQIIICSAIARGKSIKDACRLAHVPESTHYAWIAQLPAYEATVRRARAILAEQHLSDLDEMLFKEPDPQRLAIMQRHYHWKASKLIPRVYGDKLDVNISATVDIGEALATARARAALRPRCDPADVIEGEVIDSKTNDDACAVDKQSTLPGFPDIFS